MQLVLNNQVRGSLFYAIFIAEYFLSIWTEWEHCKLVHSTQQQCRSLIVNGFIHNKQRQILGRKITPVIAAPESKAKLSPAQWYFPVTRQFPLILSLLHGSHLCAAPWALQHNKWIVAFTAIQFFVCFYGIAYLVGSCGTTNPQTNGNSVPAEQIFMALPDEIAGTDHCGCTLILLRSQKAERIPHQNSSAFVILVHKAADKDGVCRKTQICFCFTTAGRKPDQIDDPALITVTFIHGTKIHQHKCQLEGTPLAINPLLLVVPGSDICCDRHYNRIDQADIACTIIFPFLQRKIVMQLLHQHGQIHVLERNTNILVLLQQIHTFFHSGQAYFAVCNVSVCGNFIFCREFFSDCA